MAQVEDVVIVGGGIGGLATALALSRSGAVARIKVLERADEFGEIGAGLQLAPNAFRALEELGVTTGAIDEYAFHPGRLVMMDALSGEPITALDLGGPFRARYGKPYVVMHRGDLLRLLLDTAKRCQDVELCSGETAIDAVTDGHTATVYTAEGRYHHADLAIGADGLRSMVRERTVNDGEPVASGYVTYRGTLPFDRIADVAGGKDVVLWAGPRMHLVQYPIRRGELYNQVVCFRSDRYSPDHDDWGTPNEIDARYADACPRVRAGVELIERDRRWKMVDREPVDSWVHGRLALLGDAAHPMLQYVAQGACQAMEDAVCLGRAIARAPTVAAALADYQRERMPRTARVQRTARQFGEILHLEGMGAAVRNRLLRLRRADDYSESDWLHAHR